jgi:Asp-tRNA(Asn)/Glu-tRNA(Gln) amidotransferase A subunit family amidase
MTKTFSVAKCSVIDIAGTVARGDVTPSEVLESVIERIEATEPRLKAWTTLKLDVSREEAAVLTAEAKSGKLRGPLHGVPVGVKEWFNVAGFPTLLKGMNAPPEPRDATVVARLRAAGAIIVGKTTVPLDDKPPATTNPYNVEHTAGGSSSGSGAVVGGRVVPMTLAEQTAGSGLRPAAYCGVAGIKPTYGYLSRYGLFPGSWSRDHATLIGYTMADIALVMSCLAGYDPLDPTTAHIEPMPAGLDLASLGAPRIGVIRNFFPERLQPDMLAAIEINAAKIKAAGATVVDVNLPAQFDLAWKCAEMTWVESVTRKAGSENKPVRLEDLVSSRASVGTAGGVRASELVPATYFIQARRIRTWLTGMLTTLMREQGLDALLTAPAPGGAPKGLVSTGDPTLQIPWSFLGFPCTTINGGLGSDGMPLGLHFASTPRTDYELMRTTAWCEKVIGLLPPPEL